MDAGTLGGGTQTPPAFSPCGLPPSLCEDHPPRDTQQEPLGPGLGPARRSFLSPRWQPPCCWLCGMGRQLGLTLSARQVPRGTGGPMDGRIRGLERPPLGRPHTVTTYHLHDYLLSIFLQISSLSFYLNAYFGFVLSNSVCEITTLRGPVIQFFLIHINTTIKID